MGSIKTAMLVADPGAEPTDAASASAKAASMGSVGTINGDLARLFARVTGVELPVIVTETVDPDGLVTVTLDKA